MRAGDRLPARGTPCHDAKGGAPRNADQLKRLIERHGVSIGVGNIEHDRSAAFDGEALGGSDERGADATPSMRGIDPKITGDHCAVERRTTASMVMPYYSGL
jgi:hypothetical protein